MKHIIFKSKIKNIKQAKLFIEYLNNYNLHFHLEDDAHDIINLNTDKKIFNYKEAVLVNKRINEIYSLNWIKEGYTCPIDYLSNLL